MQDTVFDPEKYTSELKEAWSESALGYDGLSSEHFATFTEIFLKFAELRNGETVLDVACGPGIVSFAATKAVSASGKVVAVDLAPGMVKLASEKAKRQRFHNIQFLEMNAEQLDFPDNHFDVVLCQLGLMLFARPTKALGEMRRVVKRGGRVACLVQGVEEKMIFTSLPTKVFLKYFPAMKLPGAPTLYSFGPPGALEQSFEEAGLKNITTRRQSGFFSFSAPDTYWDTLKNGSARLRSALLSIEAGARERVQKEIVEAAKAYWKGNHLEIPYEVVMGKGIKA